MVATGEGEPTSGACCTASRQRKGARLFFDVRHPHWGLSDSYPLSITANKWKIAAHEYLSVPDPRSL